MDQQTINAAHDWLNGVVELDDEQMWRFAAALAAGEEVYPPVIVAGEPHHPNRTDYLGAAVDYLIGDRTIMGTAAELRAQVQEGQVYSYVLQEARGVLVVARPDDDEDAAAQLGELRRLVEQAPAVDYDYQR